MFSKYITKAHLIEIATNGPQWDLPRQLRLEEVEGIPDVSYSIISATRISNHSRRCAVALRRGVIIFDVPVATYRTFPQRDTSLETSQ
jgi:hypothetical protein